MEQYLIYLRKSRKDQDLEARTGVSDTLRRHREALLALAEARGYDVARIYEEVVSGDTIAERPEMRKLLSAVETGAFAGVLVMEIPRLARGNTRDQGVVAETFQYSGTRIITPEKIYDPADEADEEYFEFGLFLSRREYKAINRRLQRGRLASLSEGKYIAGSAPYGYRRVRVPHQRGYTLEIVPETGEIVREIFQLYTGEDTRPLGSHSIAQLLNARRVPSPGGLQWTASSVRDILKNPTYAGYLRWSHRPAQKQMVNGTLTVSHPVNREAPLQAGLHPALISQVQWAAAQSILSSRSHAPLPGRKGLADPLAGLVRCSLCGRSLVQLPQGGGRPPLLLCPTRGCATVSSRRDVVERALLDALGEWLKDYAPAPDCLGQEEVRPPAAGLQLTGLQKSLASIARQKEGLYDLLEQGIYDRGTFEARSRTLDARMVRLREQLEALSLHSPPPAPPAAVRHTRTIPELYRGLSTPAEQNTLLKTVVDHVVYAKSMGGQWRKSDLTLYIYPKLPQHL